MSLIIGHKAPDFKTKDQNGNDVSLSTLKGKKVILYFYPKDMTPGCTAEACNLRDNYKALQKAGYEILGVSTDSEKSHLKFIEKEKLPFQLLADIDKKLHQKYGTWVEKSMYGRTYMGTARVTYVIDETGIIKDIIEKVDTKNHTEQILSTSVKSPKNIISSKESLILSSTQKPRKRAIKKITKK